MRPLGPGPRAQGPGAQEPRGGTGRPREGPGRAQGEPREGPGGTQGGVGPRAQLAQNTIRLSDNCCCHCFFCCCRVFFWLLSLFFLAAVIGFCGLWAQGPGGPGPREGPREATTTTSTHYFPLWSQDCLPGKPWQLAFMPLTSKPPISEFGLRPRFSHRTLRLRHHVPHTLHPFSHSSHCTLHIQTFYSNRRCLTSRF